VGEPLTSTKREKGKESRLTIRRFREKRKRFDLADYLEGSSEYHEANRAPLIVLLVAAGRRKRGGSPPPPRRNSFYSAVEEGRFRRNLSLLSKKKGEEGWVTSFFEGSFFHRRAGGELDLEKRRLSREGEGSADDPTSEVSGWYRKKEGNIDLFGTKESEGPARRRAKRGGELRARRCRLCPYSPSSGREKKGKAI